MTPAWVKGPVVKFHINLHLVQKVIYEFTFRYAMRYSSNGTDVWIKFYI